MSWDFKKIKQDAKEIIEYAQNIRILTGDVKEIEAMNDIEDHATKILEILERIEEVSTDAPS